MMKAGNHLGYGHSERSDSDDSGNGYKSKKVTKSYSHCPSGAEQSNKKQMTMPDITGICVQCLLFQPRRV